MSRLDRVQQLQQAVTQYIDAEKTSIENQVSVLEAILSGRTGGQGVQQANQDVVAAVAQNDIAAYLKGG